MLQASNEIEAAQAFAFVTAYSSCLKSAIVPTRKISIKDLRKTFGHANVNSLKQLVASTNRLELTPRNNFTCKACLISNAQKQISRAFPQLRNKGVSARL
jgi:hypothetical protein